MSKELLSVVADLLGQRASSITIQAKESFGNNAIFVAQSPSGRFLVKKYFRDGIDLRNRGGTEFAFSRYLWSEKVTEIPEPLHYSDSEGVGIFQFLEGEPFTEGSVEHYDVRDAFSFISRINRNRQSNGAISLPKASEACFTIKAHLETVEKRIKALEPIEQSTNLDTQATSFVSHSLMPQWQRCRDEVLKSITSAELESEIALSKRCLSPSDFGFHNAMRVKDRLYFFDFEYAGWDDPAKLLCDFYHQPRVPVPQDTFDDAIERVATGLSIEPNGLRARVKLLSPIYGLKWCCILLNEFLPSGNKRRKFSGITDIEQRKATQLQKAQNALTRLQR